MPSERASSTLAFTPHPQLYIAHRVPLQRLGQVNGSVLLATLRMGARAARDTMMPDLLLTAEEGSIASFAAALRTAAAVHATCHAIPAWRHARVHIRLGNLAR